MIINKSIKTGSKEELINITGIVEEELRSSGIKEGRVLVFVPHTTAGVTINENADPDVRYDIIKGLRGLKFESMDFDHSEGNSPAHLKASLMGSSVNVIVDDNKLLLGVWQGIYFCEFDGPRNRKFIIQIQ
jgi:secondary thiamine-phosphate synthase enzyme